MIDPTTRLPQPFWLGSRMEDECLLFICGDDSSRPSASLLFAPSRILSVRRADGTAEYREGKDYLLGFLPDAARHNSLALQNQTESGPLKGEAVSSRGMPSTQRIIFLPPGSAIPFKTAAEMKPPPGTPQSIAAARDGRHHLFFSEGHVFHDLQTMVTYDHADDTWKGSRPPSGLDALPKTAKKLRGGAPLRLVLFGDSITAGANASQRANIPPFLPPYGEQVAAEWEHRYGSIIACVNVAIAGKTSAWGLEHIGQVADAAPDIVVLAFGMNDAAGGVTPARFRENIRGQMLTVRNIRPATEFILVAGMTGNPEWTGSAPGLYPLYRDELRTLCAPGVALADVTSIWSELVKRKGFASLTGNGVNHPNDFGHRVYAQVILALTSDA